MSGEDWVDIAHGKAQQSLLPVDLFDEASDPRTPPERLRQLVRATSRVYLNPSCPLDLLKAQLLTHSSSHHAWLNPSVPLLLLMQPLPEFRDRAFAQLRAMGRRIHMRCPKRKRDKVLAWWAGQENTGFVREVRAFARHLASLFGYPWPEPP